jgi:hypothetical protein
MAVFFVMHVMRGDGSCVSFSHPRNPNSLELLQGYTFRYQVSQPISILILLELRVSTNLGKKMNLQLKMRYKNRPHASPT